jgi:hypothetical protein
MSDGMSEYWRAKRAYDREQKIMKHLLDFVTALLRNRPTMRMCMQQMDKDGFGLD